MKSNTKQEVMGRKAHKTQTAKVNILKNLNSDKTKQEHKL